MSTGQVLRRAATGAACSAPVAKMVSTGTHGKVRSHGLTVDLSHPDVPDRIRAAVFWRLYERAEIGLIQRYLPADSDVVELGSSFGVTAAHALARIGPGRRLIAVEANQGLLAPLGRVLDDQRAEVVHGAVAYDGTDPTVVFHVHPANHLHSRVNDRPDSVPVKVPRVRLGQLAEDYGLDWYSLIADVEGAEAGLLEEDGEALARCRCMIIELHATTYKGRRVERSEMMDRVHELGFRKVDDQRRTAVFVRS